MKTIASVGEGARLVRKSEHVRFLEPILPFITRRFAPRPISPKGSDPGALEVDFCAVAGSEVGTVELQ